MGKVDFFSAYKEIRNRWRKFQRDSIVEALLQVLAEPSASRLDDLKKAPWQALLLLKWVLQDSEASDHGGKRITLPELHDLRQRVHGMTLAYVKNK